MSRILCAMTGAALCLAGGPALADLPADVELVPAFGGATFDTPLAVRYSGDGTGRRFVVERGGVIRIVESDGTVSDDAFLDLSASVDTTGEGGLLGLAFHPLFATNGRFFVNYTYDGNPGGEAVELITRIAEFHIEDTDTGLGDPASEQVVLEIPQGRNNHNGGDLHFGPDGYLWIATGDGGGSNDPCNRAQTLDPDNLEEDCGANHATTAPKALLGKMLRIDVNQFTPAGDNRLCGAAGDGSAAYSAPSDNPHAVSDLLIFRDRFETVLRPCAETWAYGFRNPYRFSFDRDTGDVWIGDVGQTTWEEVNLERTDNSGGDNYGWKICEGNWESGSTTEPCPLSEHHGPLHEYANDSTNCSVTGGFRYRGPVDSLNGRYVFGDFCSAKVWFVEETAPDEWEVLEFDDLGGNIYGFGEDADGELYLTRGDDILLFDGDR